MSKFFYNQINKLANEAFQNKLSNITYNEWLVHWFSTAVQFRNNFEQDGLIESAAYIDKLIQIQLNLSNKKDRELILNRVKGIKYNEKEK